MFIAEDQEDSVLGVVDQNCSKITKLMNTIDARAVVSLRGGGGGG